jgi:hypothetical protein
LECAVSNRSTPGDPTDCMCVYCGEPLPFTENGIKAWRVGDKFVCNEFCADGILPGNGNSKSSSDRSASVLKRIYPTD